MTPKSNRLAAFAARFRAENALDTDFGTLSSRASPLFKAGTVLVTALALFVAAKMLFSHAEFLPNFLLIALPMIAGLWVWTSAPKPGFPLLPVFLLQQGVVYGTPLAMNHPGLTYTNPGIIAASCGGVGLFLTFCIAGWAGGRLTATSRPSRANFGTTRKGPATRRSFYLALFLLGICLAFHLLSRSGLLYVILPGSLGGVFPVIRTAATAAGMLGALFGGIAVGSRPGFAAAASYWSLLATIFFLTIADVLLSSASGIVLSAAVGQALGRRTIPMGFLMVAFAAMGFLNQGKFVMRERYWGVESNTTRISLIELPVFYLEWAGESAALFIGSGSTHAKVVKGPDDDGQSILERVNNLQNMTFVLESLAQRRAPLLMGETYALIPPLFIPRFLWPGKPRTHEGQILLNMHFGRQLSVEATEKTYIAWGLLPEAVGNFGAWFGPALLGLILGVVMGWLETVSRLKRLFSVEGLVLSGVLLITAISYEQVASVFLTSLFQSLVAITAGGFVLRLWFGVGQPLPRPASKPSATAARGGG